MVSRKVIICYIENGVTLTLVVEGKFTLFRLAALIILNVLLLKELAEFDAEVDLALDPLAIEPELKVAQLGVINVP